MAMVFRIFLAFCIFSALLSQICSEGVKIVNVEVGGHCALGAAPVGPGGSWQIVEKNVVKVCPAGTSCRMGACNCNDLADGTVTAISYNYDTYERSCKNVAGQHCTSSDECFYQVGCINGVCTCPTDKSVNCPSVRYDVHILA